MRRKINKRNTSHLLHHKILQMQIHEVALYENLEEYKHRVPLTIQIFKHTIIELNI
jgi:hypothetical protein